jgi:polyhydroxyalkanoate synthesis regulator phasin
VRKVQEKTGSEMEGEISPEKCKDFYKIWIETYSETFKEFMKSDHFASDMGKLNSHLMDFQKYNRDMLEENCLKPMNLPTKTEIDEINKELYSLKKTVKELTSHIKALEEKK